MVCLTMGKMKRRNSTHTAINMIRMPSLLLRLLLLIISAQTFLLIILFELPSVAKASYFQEKQQQQLDNRLEDKLLRLEERGSLAPEFVRSFTFQNHDDQHSPLKTTDDALDDDDEEEDQAAESSRIEEWGEEEEKDGGARDEEPNRKPNVIRKVAKASDSYVASTSTNGQLLLSPIPESAAPSTRARNILHNNKKKPLKEEENSWRRRTDTAAEYNKSGDQEDDDDDEQVPLVREGGERIDGPTAHHHSSDVGDRQTIAESSGRLLTTTELDDGDDDKVPSLLESELKQQQQQQHQARTRTSRKRRKRRRRRKHNNDEKSNPIIEPALELLPPPAESKNEEEEKSSFGSLDLLQAKESKPSTEYKLFKYHQRHHHDDDDDDQPLTPESRIRPEDGDENNINKQQPSHHHHHHHHGHSPLFNTLHHHQRHHQEHFTGSSQNNNHPRIRHHHQQTPSTSNHQAISSKESYVGEKAVTHEGSLSQRTKNSKLLCKRVCNPNATPEFENQNNVLVDGGEEEVGRGKDASSLSPVCASNGQLYGSLCELKSYSCRNNLHLLQMSNLYCAQRHASGTDDIIKHNQSRPASLFHSHLLESNYNTTGNDEKVRIVELRNSCNRLELEEMKLMLFREFLGSISSMFNYFDSNGDKLIEAHELWPRKDSAADLASNNLLYAQIWDEHSNWCAGSHHNNNNDNNIDSQPLKLSSISSDVEEQQKQNDLDKTSGLKSHSGPIIRKCWYFLDFAFEPKYSNNSCSLSHLMLFDLSHPSSYFTYETFKDAFTSTQLKALASLEQAADVAPEANGSNIISDKGKIIVSDKKPLTRFTNIALELGDSVVLSCLGKNNFSVINHDPTNKLQDQSELRIIEDQLLEEEATESAHDEVNINNNNNNNSDDIDMIRGRCLWRRYSVNLASIRDSHIFIDERTITEKDNEEFVLHDLVLNIKDAQLYLSGQYKCACRMKKLALNFEHVYNIQVIAKPRVVVEPKYQRTLSQSKVSFDCHYDYIDTGSQLTLSNENIFNQKNLAFQSLNAGKESKIAPDASNLNNVNNVDGFEESGLFGLKVGWFKDERSLVDKPNQQLKLDNVQTNNGSYNRGITEDTSSFENEIADSQAHSAAGDDDSFYETEVEPHLQNFSNVDPRSAARPFSRTSITMASSRLTLEGVQANDSGHYTCRVGVPINTNLLYNSSTKLKAFSGKDINAPVSSHYGRLLVEDSSRIHEDTQQGEQSEEESSFLWMFHDNGISIYKLQNGDGQEMELVHEINGHSLVSSEVDGNWNQLTLCGGLNPEQVVICEWSDNALYININYGATIRKYVYVAQPNLNRVIVLDGLKFEIVAIINTEPQPRKLHLYKPNKMHLSKWVRRRLSPIANARWLAAIGTHAHPLKTTPEDSSLYSTKPEPSNISPSDSRGGEFKLKGIRDDGNEQTGRKRRSTARGRRRLVRNVADGVANQLPSSLIQHDIWLLCYGQPLVVDPSSDQDGDEQHLEDLRLSPSPYSKTFTNSKLVNINNNKTSAASNPTLRLRTSKVQPFTPRLNGAAGSSFGWSMWPNRESRLRNRKSVHIIQSTFFPQFLSDRTSQHHHHHDDILEGSEDYDNRKNNETDEGRSNDRRRNDAHSVVRDFKRTAVITTHHVYAGLQRPLRMKPTTSTSHNLPDYMGVGTHFGGINRASSTVIRRNLHEPHPQFDLIQDLYVPTKPYSMEFNQNYKIHHSYVTHYDEQRLFRVSMDEYRYDQEIDLENCDPINLLTTAQGLLVVQCREPISHNLIGQLVLDELTSSHIEFNANIRAQESYVSPDNRYLISIYNDQTTATRNGVASSGSDYSNKNNKTTTQEERETLNEENQSIIYVQSISVSGLKLRYEVKTSSLDISQCSFVWKDGYYAAIFVSTNRREQQSETLSLRLADGRLELMARVSGFISSTHTRRKDQLLVSSKLRLAALSTTMGTYVIDLEDNRVSQSLRHHQSPPTLLWV